MSVIQTVANRNRIAAKPEFGIAAQQRGAEKQRTRIENAARRPNSGDRSAGADRPGEPPNAGQHRTDQRSCPAAAPAHSNASEAPSRASNAANPGARIRGSERPATSASIPRECRPRPTRRAQERASRRHRPPRAQLARARRPMPCAASGCSRRCPRRFRRQLSRLVGPRHDPVWAIRPPKRRSRRRYSAMAPSSADRSKSGQLIGTKTSSL